MFTYVYVVAVAVKFCNYNFVTFADNDVDSQSSPIYWITSVGHGTDPSFLAVSPQVTLVINQVVGCRYFLPGPWLFSHQRDHPLGWYQIILLGGEAHRCK